MLIVRKGGQAAPFQLQAIVGRLAGVATRLWLQSPCDRDLTLAAAAKVVAQNEGKIRQFLEQ